MHRKPPSRATLSLTHFMYTHVGYLPAISEARISPPAADLSIVGCVLGPIPFYTGAPQAWVGALVAHRAGRMLTLGRRPLRRPRIQPMPLMICSFVTYPPPLSLSGGSISWQMSRRPEYRWLIRTDGCHGFLKNQWECRSCEQICPEGCGLRVEPDHRAEASADNHEGCCHPVPE